MNILFILLWFGLIFFSLFTKVSVTCENLIRSSLTKLPTIYLYIYWTDKRYQYIHCTFIYWILLYFYYYDLYVIFSQIISGLFVKIFHCFATIINTKIEPKKTLWSHLFWLHGIKCLYFRVNRFQYGCWSSITGQMHRVITTKAPVWSS